MIDSHEMAESRVDDAGSGELPVLVRQHLDWVYSLCRRSVRDAAMAEDVTQTVFLILIRKAKQLPQGVNMSGWLFKTARYCCRSAMRDEQTRRRHEFTAGSRRTESVLGVPTPEEELLPLLDEHLAALGEADRAAVLLRYYQRCSFAEVGMQLDISEEAAKKRVQRAVEKLRARMAAKGVALTADALAAILTEKLVQPAPGKLMAAVLAHATHGTAATAMSAGQKKLVAKLAVKTISSSEVAIGAVGVVLAVGLVATGVAAVLANHNPPTPLPPKIAAIPAAALAPAATAKRPMLTQAQWAAVFQAYARKIRALSVRATFVTRNYTSRRWIRNFRAAIKKSDPKHWRQQMLGLTPGWLTRTEAVNLKWDVPDKLVKYQTVGEVNFIFHNTSGKAELSRAVDANEWVIGRQRVWQADPELEQNGKVLSSQWSTTLYHRSDTPRSRFDWMAAWGEELPGWKMPLANQKMRRLEHTWVPLVVQYTNEQLNPLQAGPFDYRLIHQGIDRSTKLVELTYLILRHGKPTEASWEVRDEVELAGGLRIYRESLFARGPTGRQRSWQADFSHFKRTGGIWFPTRIHERDWYRVARHDRIAPLKNRLQIDCHIAISRLSITHAFPASAFTYIPPSGGTITDAPRRIEYHPDTLDYPQKIVPGIAPTAYLKGFAMPAVVIKRFVPPETVHRLSAAFTIKNTAGRLADFQLHPQGNAVTVSPPAFTLFTGGSQKIHITMKKPPGDRPYCFYLSLTGRRGPPTQRKLSTTVPVFFLPSPALAVKPGSIILSPGNFTGRSNYSVTLQFLRPLGGSVVVDMIKPGSRSVAVPHWSQKSMNVVIQPAAGATAIFSHVTVLYTYNGHLEKMRIPVIGLRPN